MNILPLVSALLIILTLLSQLLIEQKVATHWEEKSSAGYLQAQRVMRNHVEAKHFALAAKADVPQKQKKEKKKKEIGYLSRREKPDLHESSRLNISSLLQKEGSSDRLYETAARLLVLLYGESSFFKEAKEKVLDLEYRLLDQIIRQGIEHPDALSLEELRPEDPLFSTLFYKMMQGTNSYDLKKHQGYPPLSDFISIEKKTKALNFYFTSQPLLVAFFGEKLASEIAQIEKRKWEKDHKHRTVTKKELTDLLNNNPAQKIKMSDIEEFIAFSRNSNSKTHSIGRDEKTGIRLKQPLK